MKTNTKLRKRTHKFIDNSRVTKVVVMPRFHTIAYSQRDKYGLPAIFEVDHQANHSNYVKSLISARNKADLKQGEVNGAILKDMNKGVPKGHEFKREHQDFGTYIMKKLRSHPKELI